MIAVTAAVRGPIHPSQLNYPDGGATLMVVSKGRSASIRSTRN